MEFIEATYFGESSNEETKDCAVRALANASMLHYDEAHELLAYHGRPDRKSTPHDTMIAAYREAGFKNIKTFGSTKAANFYGRKYSSMISSKEEGTTLKNFCKKNPKGKFIVVYSGHALAVVDGNIIDKGKNPANKRVILAFSKG